jgi:Fis family transcriptional regulator
MSSIEESVRRNVQEYFKNLDGTPPAGVYDMLIRAVEKPLLEVVMAQAGHNQSKAADWLGLNRNTLRKKLVDHGMLKGPAP